MRRQAPIKVDVHFPDDKEAFRQLFIDAVFDSIVQLARTTPKIDPTDEENIIIRVSFDKLIKAMWDYEKEKAKRGVKPKPHAYYRRAHQNSRKSLF